MSEVNLSTDETRVSYGIGRQLGDQLRDNPPPGVSLDAILAGLTDAFAGKPSRVGQEEMSASFKVIREIMQAEAAAKAEAAAGEGLAFLAENAKRDGITTLASGLQFEVLTAGEGAKPSREDSVRTHYHGTLIDGTVFDSSYERGQPAEFPVGGVIAGWTEALQQMAPVRAERTGIRRSRRWQHPAAQRTGVRRRVARRSVIPADYLYL
jgi:FKBP-type peptidyl-prolyl cis-trans isomerase FklB